jgi:hypothetical protein
MAINIEAKQSRLEELIALQRQLEGEIKIGKAMASIGIDLSTAIDRVFIDKGIDVGTFNGRFLSLVVNDGHLTVDIADNPAPCTTTRKANTNKANTDKASNYDYVLADGRKFSRVVDAIEAITGKPNTIKHDGRTFPDGKAILRYERLTKEFKAAIKKQEIPVVITTSAEPIK